VIVLIFYTENLDGMCFFFWEFEKSQYDES
jgi:hypothetical protein